jgi:hypothetical protein
MPKMYLKNYPPSSIKSCLPNLHDYYISTKTRKNLYSPEGIFVVKSDRVCKLIPHDMELEDLDDYIVDNSVYKEEDVLSQVPSNGIYTEIEELHFCIGKKSNVHFVVEGTYDKSSVLVGDLTIGQDRYKYFTPTDFYFDTRENMNNELILKEVNVILSII